MYSQSCDGLGESYYSFLDIKEILDDNSCNSCHSSEGDASQWVYDSYEEALTVGQCNIDIIVHGDASMSLLFDKINGGLPECGEPMYAGLGFMSEKDKTAIENWINAGATQDCLPLYDEIETLFTDLQCQSCHNAQSSWSPYTYDHAIGNFALCDDLIIPYQPRQSHLLDILDGKESPCGDTPLHSPISKKHRDKIYDWIAGGALEGALSLPVELSFFDAIKSSYSDAVILSWESVQEIETDRYIIQASFDGRQFQNIAEQEAVGGQNVSTLYEYKDRTDYIGIKYYRLQIIDEDGTFSYSTIVSVRKNPTKEILTLESNLIAKGTPLILNWYSAFTRTFAKAVVIDMEGHIRLEFTVQEGINEIILEKINQGMYFILIEDHFDSYQLERFLYID